MIFVFVLLIFKNAETLRNLINLDNLLDIKEINKKKEEKIF